MSDYELTRTGSADLRSTGSLQPAAGSSASPAEHDPGATALAAAAVVTSECRKDADKGQTDPVQPAVGPEVDLVAAAPSAYEAMEAFDETVSGAGSDPRLSELLKLRVSQLNGCDFCVSLHRRKAARAGESEERMAALAHWPESTVFSEAEQAALGLSESLTGLIDKQDVQRSMAAASGHFDERQLAGLVWDVIVINAWNRFAIAAQLGAEEA